MRRLILLLTCALAACATARPDRGLLVVETTSGGQPITGASCMVRTDTGQWPLVTPAPVQIGDASGDLRIACDKPGFRPSEFIYRTRVAGGSGFGVGFGSAGRFGFGLGLPLGSIGIDYPSRVTVDLSPL